MLDTMQGLQENVNDWQEEILKVLQKKKFEAAME